MIRERGRTIKKELCRNEDSFLHSPFLFHTYPNFWIQVNNAVEAEIILSIWIERSPSGDFFILPVFQKTEEIIAGSGLISKRRC